MNPNTIEALKRWRALIDTPDKYLFGAQLKGVVGRKWGTINGHPAVVARDLGWAMCDAKVDNFTGAENLMQQEIDVIAPGRNVASFSYSTAASHAVVMDLFDRALRKAAIRA